MTILALSKLNNHCKVKVFTLSLHDGPCLTTLTVLAIFFFFCIMREKKCLKTANRTWNCSYHNLLVKNDVSFLGKPQWLLNGSLFLSPACQISIFCHRLMCIIWMDISLLLAETKKGFKCPQCSTRNKEYLSLSLDFHKAK